MRTIQIKIAPGAAYELAAVGDYVRVRQSAVDLLIENPDANEIIEVSQGDDFQFTRFQRLRISHTNGAEQTVKLIIASGKKAGSSQVSGSISGTVAISSVAGQSPVRATGSNAGATVTNASAQLVAVNASRNYLLIQNKDATGNIWINFGAAATQANGVKIQPGGSFELNCNVLTAVVNAIGDIASNANVVVVTG